MANKFILLIVAVLLAQSEGANDLLGVYSGFAPKLDMSSFAEGGKDYFEAGL